MEITKAVTFQLMPLTKSKKERLELMASNFKEIYNLASSRMPSLPDIRQYNCRFVLNQWRKDFSDKIQVRSQISEEAIECARFNHQTNRTNKEHNHPILSSSIIMIHNQAWSFKKHNDTTYVVIPSEKIGKRYKPLWIPIKKSDYYNSIILTNKKFGVGQINLNNNTFTTSIKIHSKQLDYLPETFIGIDLGLNNLVTLVIINKNKKVLMVKFWNCDETRHIRNKFYEYRKEVHSAGNFDKLKESKGYESNWMKNINHNISREIIEITKKYPNPIIVMENLHKFHRLRWNYYQLRQMIEYKAKLSSILTDIVNPKNTSITCNKCGYIDKESRNVHTFKCTKCGYECNSDFNGAINIAKSMMQNEK